MSGPDLEPLDDDLARLLDAEQRRPPVDAALRARLLTRVMAAVGPGGGGAAPPNAGPPASPGAGSAGLLSKPILLGAVLGGVVSVILIARPDPRAPPPAALPAVAEARVAAPRAAREEPTTAVSAAVTAPLATTRASAARPDESLGAERRVLDEAQRALAGGRSEAAMKLLARHTSEFPRGRLSEEREALWIHALARAGRSDEARARAGQFRERFPESILLPSIDASVGAIP